MPEAKPSEVTERRFSMELRTGDVLSLPGVSIQMEYKKGQVARMVITAPIEIPIKKIPAVARGVPSLPI